MSPLLRNPNFKPEARPRPDLVRPLREIEREHVERALILCGGNRTEATARLGISRSTLQRYIDAFRRQDEFFGG